MAGVRNIPRAMSTPGFMTIYSLISLALTVHFIVLRARFSLLPVTGRRNKKAGAGQPASCLSVFVVEELLIHDLPALIRHDQHDRSRAFFIVHNGGHVTFIAFIRQLFAVVFFNRF